MYKKSKLENVIILTACITIPFSQSHKISNSLAELKQFNFFFLKFCITLFDLTGLLYAIRACLSAHRIDFERDRGVTALIIMTDTYSEINDVLVMNIIFTAR